MITVIFKKLNFVLMDPFLFLFELKKFHVRDYLKAKKQQLLNRITHRKHKTKQCFIFASCKLQSLLQIQTSNYFSSYLSFSLFPAAIYTDQQVLLSFFFPLFLLVHSFSASISFFSFFLFLYFLYFVLSFISLFHSFFFSVSFLWLIFVLMHAKVAATRKHFSIYYYKCVIVIAFNRTFYFFIYFIFKGPNNTNQTPSNDWVSSDIAKVFFSSKKSKEIWSANKMLNVCSDVWLATFWFYLFNLKETEKTACHSISFTIFFAAVHLFGYFFPKMKKKKKIAFFCNDIIDVSFVSSIMMTTTMT
jgi:hypothetical protein